jgi:hypothetical protein
MSQLRAARAPFSAALLAGAVCALGACADSLAAGSAANDPLYASQDDGHTPQSSSSGPRRGHTRPVTTRELRAIQPLIDAAARVRGLRFMRDVPVLVQDPDAIMGYVDGQIKKEELDRSRLIYVALGLLPAELDVRKLLLRLMGEQIVGYYDVEAHHLVVREDVMRAFGSTNEKQTVDLAEARVVLVHELVHALQDQHLGLSEHVDQKRDSDADNAFRALIEGDATLAMIAFALEAEALPLSELTRNPTRVRNLSELVRGSPLAGSELGTAPPIVRIPLLSAYVDGLTFAANLHGAGGWGRLDRAHAEPPVSSEQVLHPERFAKHDAPERVRLPGARDVLGKAYQLVHEDTLGELELSVYFGLGSPEPQAQRAADGWTGDRLYAYRAGGGKTAIAWLTVWRDEAQAIEAEQAAVRARDVSKVDAPAEQPVLRSGRALLMLRSVPNDLQPEARTRFQRWAEKLRASPRGHSDVGQSQTD